MNKILSFLAQRRKSIIGVAGLALTVAAQKYGPGNQYIIWAVAAFAAMGIHEVPNNPSAEMAQLLSDIQSFLHPQPPSLPSKATPEDPASDWGKKT